VIVLATYRCALPGCYRSGYIEIASVLEQRRGRVGEESRNLGLSPYCVRRGVAPCSNSSVDSFRYAAMSLKIRRRTVPSLRNFRIVRPLVPTFPAKASWSSPREFMY